MAKDAVVYLTKPLAKQLARYGITVNAVAQVVIETDMIRNYLEDTKTNFLR